MGICYAKPSSIPSQTPLNQPQDKEAITTANKNDERLSTTKAWASTFFPFYSSSPVHSLFSKKSPSKSATSTPRRFFRMPPSPTPAGSRPSTCPSPPSTSSSRPYPPPPPPSLPADVKLSTALLRLAHAGPFPFAARRLSLPSPSLATRAFYETLHATSEAHPHLFELSSTNAPRVDQGFGRMLEAGVEASGAQGIGGRPGSWWASRRRREERERAEEGEEGEGLGGGEEEVDGFFRLWENCTGLVVPCSRFC